MSTKLTFGADEAGRGPILGPMVIGVVALDRAAAASLTKRGVVDSKRFGAGPDARTRREELASIIRERATKWSTRVVEVQQIDHYTFRGLLNQLEREVVHDLLLELEVGTEDRIFCDGAAMFTPLRERFPGLRAFNDGESKHTAVAAASILAKTERDRCFHEIAARYEPEFGPIAGGGYLNPATRRFLTAYEARHGTLPPEARQSWGAKKTPHTLPLFE